MELVCNISPWHYLCRLVKLVSFSIIFFQVTTNTFSGGIMWEAPSGEYTVDIHDIEICNLLICLVAFIHPAILGIKLYIPVKHKIFV